MTIFYIIWFVFFLLSLVFAFIYLCLLFVFVFVLYSPYFRHWPSPTTDAINLFCTTKKKLFLTLPSFSFLNFTFFFFFFCHLSLLLPNYQSIKEQTDKHYTNIFSNLYKLYSLSISLFYIIQEKESQTQSHRESQSQRVTKPKGQKKNHRQNKFLDSQSRNHQHQFISKNTNTTSPNIILGFEGKDRLNTCELWRIK